LWGFGKGFVGGLGRVCGKFEKVLLGLVRVCEGAWEGFYGGLETLGVSVLLRSLGKAL
jgi:hypothetical protein